MVFLDWKGVLNDHKDILAIMSVANDQNGKHAILLHISANDNMIRIINTLPNTHFNHEVDEIKLRLEGLLNGYSVVILNTEQQNLEHGTCADLSLINMYQIMQEANLGSVGLYILN